MVNYCILVHQCQPVSKRQGAQDQFMADLFTQESIKANRRCQCKKFVTKEEAKELVHQGQAEWVRMYSPTGKEYESTAAIVRSSANKTPRAQTIEKAHIERGLSRYSSGHQLQRQWLKKHTNKAKLTKKQELGMLNTVPLQDLMYDNEQSREYFREHWDLYNAVTLETRASCFLGVKLVDGKQVGYDDVQFQECPFKDRAILIYWADDRTGSVNR